METCRNCGAALSPDIEWCGLCFTPTGRVPEKELIVLPDVDADAERAAPDPWTNALFSALVVAFVVVAFIDLWNLTGDVGSAPWAAAVSFLTSVSALGLVALIVAWTPRPVAPRETLIVIERAPAERALAEPPERVEPSERIHPSIPRGSATPSA